MTGISSLLYHEQQTQRTTFHRQPVSRKRTRLTSTTLMDRLKENTELVQCYTVQTLWCIFQGVSVHLLSLYRKFEIAM